MTTKKVYLDTIIVYSNKNQYKAVEEKNEKN